MRKRRLTIFFVEQRRDQLVDARRFGGGGPDGGRAFLAVATRGNKGFESNGKGERIRREVGARFNESVRRFASFGRLRIGGRRRGSGRGVRGGNPRFSTAARTKDRSAGKVRRDRHFRAARFAAKRDSHRFDFQTRCGVKGGRIASRRNAEKLTRQGGSYPPREKGWQRKIRRQVLRTPTKTPYF